MATPDVHVETMVIIIEVAFQLRNLKDQLDRMEDMQRRICGHMGLPCPFDPRVLSALPPTRRQSRSRSRSRPRVIKSEDSDTAAEDQPTIPATLAT
eukprot:s119_g71.t1